MYEKYPRKILLIVLNNSSAYVIVVLDFSLGHMRNLDTNLCYNSTSKSKSESRAYM